MPRPLRTIKAKNFRSLADVDVDFRDFNVLIGPNGSGKSNLLKVLSFVRDTARFDIGQAIEQAGGFDRVIRQSPGVAAVTLTIEGVTSTFASGNARDSYTLSLSRVGHAVDRSESLKYKRVEGRGKRRTIKAHGQEVAVEGEDSGPNTPSLRLASDDVSALGALARVADEQIGDGPREFFSFLSDIRYLDPVVDEARTPTRISRATLDDSASNLSAALFTLYQQDPDGFQAVKTDLARCLPGLHDITFDQIGGATRAVVVQLHERGLGAPVDLADASFGTVRVLALLTALHEPEPPQLTVIEEVDHGLHPYALDVLVDRLREASNRTQIIVASHSPTLVNRLAADEIIISDRDPKTGASIIPARSADEIADLLGEGDWRAGELWFSGMLGGVPR